MSALIAMALAAQIEAGANAPEDLKPCPNPVHVQKSPKSVHVPRTSTPSIHIKPKRSGKKPEAAITDCAEGPPPSPFVTLFPPKEVPLDYTPAPEAPTFADAIGDEPLPSPALEDSDQRISPETYAMASGANVGPMVGMDAGLFVATPVSPAPEPQAWFLLLAGLGAIGWVRCYPQGRHGISGPKA